MKHPTQWLATATGKPRRVKGQSRQVRLAKGFVFQLWQYALHGVPECYGDKRTGSNGTRTVKESRKAFESSLIDLWMDLPWDDSRDASINWILADADSGVALDAIKKVFGFDMRKELRKGISTSKWMRKHGG